MIEEVYLNSLRHVLRYGQERIDRTGVGTIGSFGYDMRFNLSEDSLPVITTKRIHFKSIIHELIWFMRGDTNIKYLEDNGVRIWREWADHDGNLGPVYGAQWRNWVNHQGQTFDQLRQLIEDLQRNPHSRRHILSAWNVGQLNEMALPPCHCFVQFYVTTDHRLSCKLTQRSADMFLGVPFNISSYALLTQLMARECNYGVGELIWSGGDVHIYTNHLEQVNLQLSRQPLPQPKLWIHPNLSFEWLLTDRLFDTEGRSQLDDWIKLVDYESHGAIKAPIAV